MDARNEKQYFYRDDFSLQEQYNCPGTNWRLQDLAQGQDIQEINATAWDSLEKIQCHPTSVIGGSFRYAKAKNPRRS